MNNVEVINGVRFLTKWENDSLTMDSKSLYKLIEKIIALEKKFWKTKQNNDDFLRKQVQGKYANSLQFLLDSKNTNAVQQLATLADQEDAIMAQLDYLKKVKLWDAVDQNVQLYNQICIEQINPHLKEKFAYYELQCKEAKESSAVEAVENEFYPTW